MKQKQISKRICSLILTMGMCAGIFSGMTMQTEAATKSGIWLEVTGAGSSTLSDNEKYKPDTGYHLEYAGTTKKCTHSSSSGDIGKVEWALGTIKLKDDAYPYSDALYSKSKVTEAFLTKKVKYTGSLVGNASLTFESNFIMGKAGGNVYSTRKTDAGKGYANLSTVLCYVVVDGVKYRGAYQYVCPDGGAAYAYFGQKFSYCSTTEQYYRVEEVVQHMHCSMNPDKTCGTGYTWADGDVTYGHYNNKEGSVNSYTHYIGKFNEVPITYKIRYDGNDATSGTMADTSATYDKSVTLRANKYKRTGYTFQGWAKTKARADAGTVDYGKEASVKNLTSKDGDTVTLYAVWKINSGTVTYNSNGGTYKQDGSGVDGVHKYTSNDGAVCYYKSNSSGNIYRSTTSATAGFSQYKNTIKYNKTGTWDPVNHSTLGLSKTGYHLPDGKEWYASINSKTIYFDQNADVLANMKSYLGLADADSGSVMLFSNWTPNTYTIRYDLNGYAGAAIADTPAVYNTSVLLRECTETDFLGWAKTKDGANAGTVDYANKAGVKNLTSKNGGIVTLYAVWDDCPQIEAGDRYFNLWWAQNGKITEEELLRTASAVDTEDHELENRTSEQVASQGLPGSLSLYDYDAAVFTSMTEAGMVSVTYQAVDSAGHAVYETVTVHVYDTDPVPLPVAYTRYINREYYEKPYEEGGLHPNSIWRTDPEYRQTLENALDNLENDTPEAVYTFTPEQVQEAKEYIDEHGFSDTKEEGALQGFFERFMR